MMDGVFEVDKKGGYLKMKLNEVSVSFGIIAVGFIVVVADTLTSGRPIITTVSLFVLVLCVLIMDVMSGRDV